MRFTVSGHKNVLFTHRNTIEFTKDSFLTRKGDCILGCAADFSFEKGILKAKKIKVTITCDGVFDSFTADVNPDFLDDHEIVFRKSGFLSKRTLGINASKAARDIDRRIAEKMKNPDFKAEVRIEAV